MNFKLKYIVFLFFAVIVAVSCTNKEPETAHPNFVFILIDDLGWKDVSYMGSGYYETPNIDLLAKRGMIFTQAYANAANCAPTRACLLSGQYSPRHGVFTVAKSDRGDAKDRRLVPVKNSLTLPLEKITIAEALKKAGYKSAAFGKWHVGNSPIKQGFDVELDRTDMGKYNGGHFNDSEQYLTDQLTDKAIEFIKDNNPNKTGSPFFLYLAHHAVHTPVQAKDSLVNKYKGKTQEDCHKNPTYAAMIESVDQSVAKVNRTLEELGISENTLLIFFSDNGGHGTYTCQKPLRGGKGMYYEGGIREPLFAYWPGKIKPATVCEEPVIGTDFYPTFLELAGVEKPENYVLDGKSIVPLFQGEETIKRDALFWHFPAYLESYEGLTDESRDTVFRSRPVSVIRKGDWKLLQFHEEWVLDGGRENIPGNNSVELYNLAEDIGETSNLAEVEADKRDELLNELLKWQQEVNAPIPTEKNPEYKHQ